jgi:hypothetical protein
VSLKPEWRLSIVRLIERGEAGASARFAVGAARS